MTTKPENPRISPVGKQPPEISGGFRISPAASLSCAALFLISLAILYFQSPEGLDFELHSDTVGDLNLAHECLQRGQCRLIGVPTSYPGIHQGGFWRLHLALLSALGLSVTGIGWVSLLLAALSIPTTRLLGKTLGPRWLGRLTATSMLAFLALTDHINIQFNPVLLPLPSAGFYLSAVLAVKTRRITGYLLALVCLSLMIQIHPVTVLLVPFTALAFLLYPPERKALFFVLGPSVFLLSLLSMSREALFRSVLEFSPGELSRSPSPDPAILGLIALLLGFTLLFFLWKRTRSFSERSEVQALAILAVLPLCLELWLASRRGFEAVTFRYIAPFMAGLLPLLITQIHGLLAGTNFFQSQRLARLPLAQLAWIPLSLLLIFSIVRPFPPLRGPTFQDFDKIRQALYPETSLVQPADIEQIHSPQIRLLQAGWMLKTSRDSKGKRPPLPPLLFVKSSTPPPDSPPPGGHVLPGRSGRHLFLIPRPEVIDWRRLEFATTCREENPDPTFRTGSYEDLLEAFIETLNETSMRSSKDPTLCLLARLPIRPDARMPARLETTDTEAFSCRFVEVCPNCLRVSDHPKRLLFRGVNGKDGGSMFLEWRFVNGENSSEAPFVAEIGEGYEFFSEVIHDLH